MDYDENIRHKANQRIELQRREHHQNIQRLRTQVCRKDPRIPELDRKIQASMHQALSLTLSKDPDARDRILALRNTNLELQRQRAALLAEMGLAEDALDDRPMCPYCNDTGWVHSTMCRCLRSLCAEEQTRELSRLLDLGDQSFDTFDLGYYSTQAAEGKRSDYETMKLVRDTCRTYVSRFAGSAILNMLFTGPPGLGKTFLSACIAREISGQGYSVVYDTATNIFRQFDLRKFQSRTEEGEEGRSAVNRYLKCDLLILDDLGSEMLTPLVSAALYEVINTRLVDHLHTIISTNLTTQEIASRYTLKVASRIQGEYQVMHFCGTDIRQQKKRGSRYAEARQSPESSSSGP